MILYACKEIITELWSRPLSQYSQTGKAAIIVSCALAALAIAVALASCVKRCCCFKATKMRAPSPTAAVAAKIVSDSEDAPKLSVDTSSAAKGTPAPSPLDTTRVTSATNTPKANADATVKIRKESIRDIEANICDLYQKIVGHQGAKKIYAENAHQRRMSAHIFGAAHGMPQIPTENQLIESLNELSEDQVKQILSNRVSYIWEALFLPSEKETDKLIISCVSHQFIQKAVKWLSAPSSVVTGDTRNDHLVTRLIASIGKEEVDKVVAGLPTPVDPRYMALINAAFAN